MGTRWRLTLLSLVLMLLPLQQFSWAEPSGIRISGSSTIQPLVEKMGALYTEKYQQPVEVTGGGSGAGIKDAIAGVSDIGSVSREISSAEQSQLDYSTIGKDALAIIVNARNPITEITRNQLIDLYTGKIANGRK